MARRRTPTRRRISFGRVGRLFEVTTTAAGNTVLDAQATEHHADLAIAAAIALYLSNNTPLAFAEAPIAG